LLHHNNVLDPHNDLVLAKGQFKSGAVFLQSRGDLVEIVDEFAVSTVSALVGTLVGNILKSIESRSNLLIAETALGLRRSRVVRY
jgi:hypothetical protein